MKTLIKLILNAIAVVITVWLLSKGVHLGKVGLSSATLNSWGNLGVFIDNYGYAFILAAILAILNVSAKPALIFFTIPATIFSLGLFLLVINAFIVMIASAIIPKGFQVNSFWWALLFSIVLSIVNNLIERLTVKRKHRDDSFQVYDKDGNRMV